MKKQLCILIMLLAFGFCNFCEGQGKDTVKEININTKIDDITEPVLSTGYSHFPGGDEALNKYIEANLHYPNVAKKEYIQGTVYIYFYVEKDGSLTDIKLEEGIGGGCDEEALRIVKNMPKWIPGSINGKPALQSQYVRIKFTLDTTKTK